MGAMLTRMTFRATFVLVTTVNVIVIYGIGHFWMFSANIFTTSHVNPGGNRIHTPGCSLPLFDPFDPSVRRFFSKTGEPACPGNPNFVSIRKGIPFINDAALKEHNVQSSEVRCFYTRIYQNLSLSAPDENYFFGPETPLRFGEPLKEEFLHLECVKKSEPKKPFHRQFLLNPIIKESVEERCRRTTETTPHNMSVLVLGLDSVSYLNFERHMRLTGQYVRKDLEAFELFGYNKVGDNSFPNQVPLLTGLNATYAYSTMRDKFFDDMDMIWKAYADRGYRTMFLEESPYYGLFNYYLNGFRRPPTDYYLRHAIQAMDASPYKTSGRPRCLGPVLPFTILLDYLARFADEMQDRPFFSYSWISEVTHDSLNGAGYADAPFWRLFKRLHDSGVFNKTVVVFLSDHGLRFGPIRSTFIGKFEDRQPFAFLLFPRWFLQAHPVTAKTLQVNQMRLTTHFDVHATLLELLDFPLKESPKTEYGLSLFHEISEDRTCEDAHISHQWCSCQTAREVEVSPSFALLLGDHLVGQINTWVRTEPRKCSDFHLMDVMDVTALQPTRNEKATNASHYWVTVRVSPGGGIFEATLRVQEDNISVVDQVSRCNWYFGQAYCVLDHWLEKFCYCRRTVGFVL